MIADDRVGVLQIVAPAVAGADGRRGVNGPELRSLNAIRVFNHSRVRLVIAYTSTGRLWEEFGRQRDIRLVDFASGGKLAGEDVPKIRRLICEARADVVHTQGPGSLDLWATVAARSTRARMVITRPVMIEDLALPAWRRVVYASVDRWTLSMAQRVVAVSRAGNHHLQSVARVAPSRLSLIYNGVDLDRFCPGIGVRERFGIPAGTFVLGMCAQFTPVKNWEGFVDLLANVRAQHPDVHGLAVGDGPVMEQVKARARTRGLDGALHFSGYVPDVESALRCMDLFVLTSHREGLSVAVLEALGCGLPIVASDVGGIREQVRHGENGFVFAAGDHRMAEGYVRNFLNSEELRLAAGRRSREIAEEHFDQRRMVREYERLYLAEAAESCGRSF